MLFHVRNTLGDVEIPCRKATAVKRLTYYIFLNEFSIIIFYNFDWYTGLRIGSSAALWLVNYLYRLKMFAETETSGTQLVQGSGLPWVHKNFTTKFRQYGPPALS